MAKAADTLKEISQALAGAVDAGARATVRVDARDGYPSSGVLVATDRVLTSNHGVERDGDITVTLPDGKEVRASLAGRDPDHDLALLRLEEAAPGAGTFAEEGHAVGQLVLALARPTDEGIQASLGVVGIAEGRYQSWRGGSVEGVFRTDAAVFPGFAGGPLVDVEGRIVGINTFGFRFGATLTIPAKKAREIAARLEEGGSVKRGYLGVRTQVVELPEAAAAELERAGGLLVVGVEKESPAAAGGLLVGDILVAVDGAPVSDHRDLMGRLLELAGRQVELEIVRAGRREKLTVRMGERASAEPAWGGGGPHHGGPHWRHRRRGR